MLISFKSISLVLTVFNSSCLLKGLDSVVFEIIEFVDSSDEHDTSD